MYMSAFGENYWQIHLPGIKPVDEIVQQFKESEIPIHTMYTHTLSYLVDEFVKIARNTDGKSSHLDIKSSTAAETLTITISLRILDNVGGIALVKDYCEQYQCSFV